MKKQTAVEWLIEKIQLTDTIIDNGESSYVILFPNLKLKDIKQAKAMEKEQIMDAYDSGEANQYSTEYNPDYKDCAPEHFYIDTYQTF
jgi:hypothetical protein